MYVPRLFQVHLPSTHQPLTHNAFDLEVKGSDIFPGTTVHGLNRPLPTLQLTHLSPRRPISPPGCSLPGGLPTRSTEHSVAVVEAHQQSHREFNSFAPLVQDPAQPHTPCGGVNTANNTQVSNELNRSEWKIYCQKPSQSHAGHWRGPEMSLCLLCRDLVSWANFNRSIHLTRPRMNRFFFSECMGSMKQGYTACQAPMGAVEHFPAAIVLFILNIVYVRRTSGNCPGLCKEITSRIGAAKTCPLVSIYPNVPKPGTTTWHWHPRPLHRWFRP
jgi:hypothetical protein